MWPWLVALGIGYVVLSKVLGGGPMLPALAPGVVAQGVSGGPYFRAYVTQINGITQAYSQAQMNLDQWKSTMASVKGHVDSDYSNGLLSADDYVNLLPMMGA